MLPGASTVYLFNSFAPGKTTNAYSFNVDMGIAQSADCSANDQFARTFQSGTTNLFSVDFAPGATNSDGTVNSYNLLYTINGAQTSTPKGVDVSAAFHLSVAVNVPNKSFSIINSSAGVTNYTTGAVSLAGLGNTDLRSVTDLTAT